MVSPNPNAVFIPQGNEKKAIAEKNEGQEKPTSSSMLKFQISAELKMPYSTKGSPSQQQADVKRTGYAQVLPKEIWLRRMGCASSSSVNSGSYSNTSPQTWWQ